METETEHQNEQSPPRPWTYHFHTLYLFNKSDLKTIIAPTALFAICYGLIHAFVKPRYHPYISLIVLVLRMPLVLAWTWTHLLIRNIANQRLPASILEDSLKNPWRPIPSKRCTMDESRRYLLWVIGVAFTLSWHFGTLGESLVLAVITWIYNDLDGANQGSWVRNALNAAGLANLYFGATVVAVGRAAAGTGLSGWGWVAVIVAVQFSTVRTEDGQDLMRWIAADMIITCSFLWPKFLGLDMLGYVTPMLLGIILAGRISDSKITAADWVFGKLGRWWLMAMCFLPVYSVIGMVVSRVHSWLWLRYTPDYWLRENGYIE